MLLRYGEPYGVLDFAVVPVLCSVCVFFSAAEELKSCFFNHRGHKQLFHAHTPQMPRLNDACNVFVTEDQMLFELFVMIP